MNEHHAAYYAIANTPYALALWMAYLLHKIIENPCRKLLIALPKLTVADVLKTLFAGWQGVYVVLMILTITALLNIHVLLNRAA
ncbi:hypothetical protein BCS42_15855 [Crenothrix sp. D3]|nr:hypothetical protein BCS42_15855 [Crenothrix sp. D3]